MVAGNEKPQILRHVRDMRPLNGFVPKVERSEATEASDIPVALPLIAPSHVHQLPPGGTRSTHDILLDRAGSRRESQWYPKDLKVDPALLDTEDPKRTQSPGMSATSPIDSKDPERALSSNCDNGTLEARKDIEGTRSLTDLQGPQASDFLVPRIFTRPDAGHETTDVRPLNGINGETGHSSKNFLSSIPKSFSNTFHESVPNTSPLTAPSSSLNNFMTAQLQQTVDAPAPGSITDELYYEESVLHDTSCHTPSADIPARLENLDHQALFANIPDHPPLNNLDNQVRPTDQAEFLNHRLPISDIKEHCESVLITSRPPGVISKETAYSHSIRGEKRHPESILDEENHPEPTSEGQNFPENILDEEFYDNDISDTQSWTDSIEEEVESPNSRDQPAKVHREVKLHRLRWRSLKTRARVSERRVELQQSREEMNDADAEFVRLSRQSWISGEHDELAMQASFKKLQDARDTYGSLEQAYNTSEERLDREEYELTRLEEKMFQDGVPLADIQDSDLESQSNSSEREGSVTLDTLKEQQNPLYKEYMSRIGDASHLREAYSYLSAEHNSLLESQEVSERFGTKMQAEDETTLAMFYAKEAKMTEELRKTDADVERLRQECIQTGLLPAEGGDEIYLIQSSDGSIGTEQAEYTRYPQLLDQPGEDEDERMSKKLLYGFRSGDTGDRITRWLLHKLRSSCSEVELLARYADGLDRIDTQKWQEQVLYFWFMDSANLPPSAYKLDPTLTARPSLYTDPNKAANNSFGEKHFIELVVRSSSLYRSLEFGMLLKLVRMKGRSAGSNVR